MEGRLTLNCLNLFSPLTRVEGHTWSLPLFPYLDRIYTVFRCRRMESIVLTVSWIGKPGLRGLKELHCGLAPGLSGGAGRGLGQQRLIDRAPAALGLGCGGGQGDAVLVLRGFQWGLKIPEDGGPGVLCLLEDVDGAWSVGESEVLEGEHRPHPDGHYELDRSAVLSERAYFPNKVRKTATRAGRY